MSNLVKKKLKNRVMDDSAFSKNFGDNIRFRKRKIEEREARMAREDALRDMALENQELGLYDDFDNPLNKTTNYT